VSVRRRAIRDRLERGDRQRIAFDEWTGSLDRVGRWLRGEARLRSLEAQRATGEGMPEGAEEPVDWRSGYWR